MKQPSRLISDGEGHWYLIPWGFEFEFEKWIADIAEYGECEFNFEKYRIDGPQSLMIKDWEIFE